MLLSKPSQNQMVSVIMPTYNHADFIERAIESVCQQSYDNYELIIIDNYSEDNTEIIVKSYQATNSKINYLKYKNNGSIAASRNHGISNAKGDYIAFLDSDDCWYPEKLENTMNILIGNLEIDVLCHGLIRKTKNKILNKIIPGPKIKEGSLYQKMLLQGNFMLTSATTVKRNVFLAINGFDERSDYICVEDYEAWLRLAKEGRRFFFLNEILGELFVHENNSSSSISRSSVNLRTVVNTHFNNAFPNSGLKRLWKYQRTIAITFCTEGRNWHEKGRHWKAINCYLRSLTIFPFSIRTWGFLVIAILHVEILLEKLNLYTLYSD